MFGIRLLQPVQAIINKSHSGRLGASLIVANLPAGRCWWHRQALDMFACNLSIQNLSFQPKPLPQRGWPEFSRQTFTKKQGFGGSRNQPRKKTFLTSTCRCDLRKTASRLSLRKVAGWTRGKVRSCPIHPWGKLSIKTFLQFFHEQQQTWLGLLETRLDLGFYC